MARGGAGGEEDLAACGAGVWGHDSVCAVCADGDWARGKSRAVCAAGVVPVAGEVSRGGEGGGAAGGFAGLSGVSVFDGFAGNFRYSIGDDSKSGWVYSGGC